MHCAQGDTGDSTQMTQIFSYKHKKLRKTTNKDPTFKTLTAIVNGSMY